MRKAIRNLFFLALLSLSLSCSKEKSEVQSLVGDNIVVPNINIKYYCTCGWGSRADSLVISTDEVRFKQDIRSWGASMRDTLIDTAFLSPLPWLDSLYYNLDTTAFKAITFNSGGLAVDGCDILLKVESGAFTHQILYDWNDSLPGMAPFMFQLDSLWSEIGLYPPQSNL